LNLRSFNRAAGFCWTFAVAFDWHLLEDEATMLRLKPQQRQMLVDKLPDVANLAVGALFLGQFLSDRPFSYVLAVFGVALWTAIIGFTLRVAGIEG